MKYLSNQKFVSLVCVIVVLIITFAAFSPVLENKFTQRDDEVHLTKNYTLRSLNVESVREIFSSTINRIYIPLSIFSLAIEYHFFKLNPFVYHLNNLLLHLCIVAFVFLFSKQLGLNVRQAGFAALLFGIHPIHVESVAWVTERKDVLYSLFYILSVICYCRYIAKIRERYLFFTLSILFGVLSMLANPMALSLPLVFCVCDWFYKRKFERTLIYEKILHILYVVPIAWITYSLHTRMPNVLSFESIFIWLWTFTFYIKMFIFPVNLIHLYELPQPISFFNDQYVLAIFIFIVFVYCCYRFRKNRMFIFSVLFFVASIFFLIRFDNVDRSIVTDRFMYLPSLGFCMLIGVLADQFLIKSKSFRLTLRGVSFIGLSVVFILLAIGTFNQSKVWKDNYTLWNYILKRTPNNITALINRGGMYHNRGYHINSMVDFNKAIQINPEYAEGYNNRGVLNSNLGNHDLALKDFNKAIELNPFFVRALHNRGVIHRMNNNFEMAREDFLKAIKINPKFLDARNSLGFIYELNGDLDQALNEYNRAIRIDPYAFFTYQYRSSIFMRKKDYLKAVDDLNKVLELDSSNAEAYNNRGLAFLAQLKFFEAFNDFTSALINNSELKDAYSNRAYVFHLGGQYEQAVNDYTSAIQLDPYFGVAYYYRSRSNFVLHKWEEAYYDIQRAEDFGVSIEKYFKEKVEEQANL